MDVTPTRDGTFQTTTATLTVSTDNTGGYTLYMRTANDKNALAGTGTNATEIASITENTNIDKFPTNAWAYTTETNLGTETLYQPIPTSLNGIIASSYNGNGAHKLTFATKIDTTIPSDQYSNSVIVSAVANPQQITLLDISNMQDMTHSICANSNEGDTKQLIDTRDDQKYWVAKLKDGNCWMTQNLALDITEAGLSTIDTDIESDWNSSSPIPPKATENTLNKTDGETVENATARSYNLGKYVLGTPTQTTSCSEENSENPITSLSMCEHLGFVPIDDSWTADFESKNGTYGGPGNYSNQETYITLDYANKHYDPHYLIGNYYRWHTATAGTGIAIIESTASGNAPGSICPKNWQLPSSTFQPTIQYTPLIRAYLPSLAISETIDDITYNIAENPLYFVRSGSTTDAAISYSGQRAYYSNSYGIYAEGKNFISLNKPSLANETKFSTAYVSPLTYISVRCVAR